MKKEVSGNVLKPPSRGTDSSVNRLAVGCSGCACL